MLLPLTPGVCLAGTGGVALFMRGWIAQHTRFPILLAGQILFRCYGVNSVSINLLINLLISEGMILGAPNNLFCRRGRPQMRGRLFLLSGLVSDAKVENSVTTGFVLIID